MTQDEQQALKRLKNDNNIVILPTDKGRVIVIMDKTVVMDVSLLLWTRLLLWTCHCCYGQDCCYGRVTVVMDKTDYLLTMLRFILFEQSKR